MKMIVAVKQGNCMLLLCSVVCYFEIYLGVHDQEGQRHFRASNFFERAQLFSST